MYARIRRVGTIGPGSIFFDCTSNTWNAPVTICQYRLVPELLRRTIDENMKDEILTSCLIQKGNSASWPSGGRKYKEYLVIDSHPPLFHFFLTSIVTTWLCLQTTRSGMFSKAFLLWRWAI